jgi:2',3'-cyclic-nucleotide 2'-phosphodiesterase (5'-nucleotidase family)
MKSCGFPWLLSNIIDEKTGKNPEGVHRCVVKERCGVRIGLIGLVEQDWIATIRESR